MSESYFDQAAAGWDEQPQRVRTIRAVGEAIIGRVPLTAQTSVLDYGCGTGLLGLYLLPRVASVTGVRQFGRHAGGTR